MVSRFHDCVWPTVNCPESPGDSVSFLRFWLRSSKSLYSLEDLSLEFCTCSWNTVRLLTESTSSFVGLANVCLWTGCFHCFDHYFQYLVVPPRFEAKTYLQLDGTCRLDLSIEHTYGVFYQSPFPQVATRGQLVVWGSDHKRQPKQWHLFHEIDLFKDSFHVVHCPCWPCCTAFVILAFYIFVFLSWMINADLWTALTCDHLVDWFQPIPCRWTSMRPRISPKVRTSFDFSISSRALNFLPDLISHNVF